MTRRLIGATVRLCTLVAVSACGGDEEAEAPPPEPVVIESPHTAVWMGVDTVDVYGPTVFAYFGVDDDTTRPSPMLLEAVQGFQAGVQSAQSPLRALGVRIEVVSAPPVLLDPGLEARAGPPLAPDSYGYLFVDAVGNVRRVTSLTSGTQMVCIAAETFGLTLDARQSASCR